jgi:hypothetical protein
MAERLTVTPAGFTILHEDGEPDPTTGKSKRRSYSVARLPEIPPSQMPSDQEILRFARENGVQLPSVTTVLGMLDKPGLVWWAERLGVEGAVTLAKDGGLPTNADAALGRLSREGLRHFQVAQRKAERGHLSHDELVAFAAGREPRPMLEIPVDDRGFIRGVSAFLADFRPRADVSELFVASLEHGYAGRLDMRVYLGVDRLPDGSPAPPGLGLIDLKSHDHLPATQAGKVKTPYPEHLLQLALYEVAAAESGYGRSEWQAVVRVDAEGRYDFTCSWLEPSEALCLLPAYRVFRSVAARVKGEADQRPVGVLA